MWELLAAFFVLPAVCSWISVEAVQLTISRSRLELVEDLLPSIERCVGWLSAALVFAGLCGLVAAAINNPEGLTALMKMLPPAGEANTEDDSLLVAGIAAAVTLMWVSILEDATRRSAWLWQGLCAFILCCCALLVSALTHMEQRTLKGLALAVVWLLAIGSCFQRGWQRALLLGVTATVTASVVLALFLALQSMYWSTIPSLFFSALVVGDVVVHSNVFWLKDERRSSDDELVCVGVATAMLLTVSFTWLPLFFEWTVWSLAAPAVLLTLLITVWVTAFAMERKPQDLPERLVAAVKSGWSLCTGVEFLLRMTIIGLDLFWNVLSHVLICLYVAALVPFHSRASSS